MTIWIPGRGFLPHRAKPGAAAGVSGKCQERKVVDEVDIRRLGHVVSGARRPTESACHLPCDPRTEGVLLALLEERLRNRGLREGEREGAERCSLADGADAV